MSDTAYEAEAAVESADGFDYDDDGFDDHYGELYDPAAEEPMVESAPEPLPYDERFDQLVQEGVDRAFAPLEDEIADYQEWAAPEPVEAPAVSTDEVNTWVGEVFDFAAREFGDFNPILAVEQLSEIFSERLQAEPDVDPFEAFEDALVEGTQNAIGIRDGAPIIDKLVKAELARVDQVGNTEFGDVIADAASPYFEIFEGMGYDKQESVAMAVYAAASDLTGQPATSPLGSIPNPTALANYYGGQARGLNAMKEVNRKNAERYAEPITSALTPEQLARKYANGGPVNA